MSVKVTEEQIIDWIIADFKHVQETLGSYCNAAENILEPIAAIDAESTLYQWNSGFLAGVTYAYGLVEKNIMRAEMRRKE